MQCLSLGLPLVPPWSCVPTLRSEGAMCTLRRLIRVHPTPRLALPQPPGRAVRRVTRGGCAVIQGPTTPASQQKRSSRASARHRRPGAPRRAHAMRNRPRAPRAPRGRPGPRPGVRRDARARSDGRALVEALLDLGNRLSGVEALGAHLGGGWKQSGERTREDRRLNNTCDHVHPCSAPFADVPLAWLQTPGAHNVQEGPRAALQGPCARTCAQFMMVLQR